MESAARPEAASHIEDVGGDDSVPGEKTQAQHKPGLAGLCSMLACPSCGTRIVKLSDSDNAFQCEPCATQFPVFHCDGVDIPWLFKDPVGAMLEWKARFNGFLHANTVELERLRRARSNKQISKLGRQRIERLLRAREQYRQQVSDILSPLQLDGIRWPADATDLLRNKMPRNQGLSSYINNIFRDWAWDNGENEAQLDAIDSVLRADWRASIGRTLTLGAGAGRLPYDMHRRYEAELSVALDLNPLLVNIGASVIQGDSLPLYEFPIAPLNEASFAVLQKCRAPGPVVNSGFHHVLADAANPPFVAGYFDTVVTPWLIDIIPHDLRSFVPQINRMLTQGGVWLNTGSLAFFHKNESWCYSQEEVLELIEKNGFEILSAERQSVPYLQSPHSAHGRTEKILSFAAVKTKDVKAPAGQTFLPKWILDTSRPVPASTESAISSSNHLLTSQVLAAIDGKSTINQIGRRLARQYGLGKSETVHAVRRILVDAWEENNVGGSSGDL